MKPLKTLILVVATISLIACNQEIETNNSIEKPSTISTENINYQIMVQRATQGAIWAMPGVGLVDFIKATRRDLGGDYGDVLI